MPPEPQTSGKEPSAGAMRAAKEIVGKFGMRHNFTNAVALIIDRESGLGDLSAALRQIATDPPVSESPTIESILNRAQRIAREAIHSQERR